MTYLKPSSPSDALAVFHAELAWAAVNPEQAAAGPALWPRFAGYYQGLARLPRKARRALQRQWRRSLGGLALLLALGQTPVLAATINVDGTSCNLVDAINAANSAQAVGGCPAGIGADTIVLAPNSTHTLTAVNNSTYGPTGLPLISSTVTIQGNGSTITRPATAPAFGLLVVAFGGDLTLQDTKLSGGVADRGGAAFNRSGTLTLTHSTVSGNSAVSGGGVFTSGTMTLTNSTVSGNSDGPYGSGGSGGGVYTSGTLTLTRSTISGNTGTGIYMRPGTNATVIQSTVSGNSGHGIGNSRGTLTVIDSTVSGNSGIGVLNSRGNATLTNSTVSGNASGNSRRGGVYNNEGVLVLTHTLISGNRSNVVPGREVRNYLGTVITDNFNLFGRNGISGVEGFTPGPTDLVPNLALIDILDHRLADNGGPTSTHALVFGSPAVDAVPAASCATATDQRGVTRPQDDNGDAIANCDIGAFEGAQAPAPPPLVEAEAPNPQIPCKDARCQVLVSCNLSQLSGTNCTNRINLFVRASAARLSDGVSAKAPRRIRFSFGVANVPPGQTKFVTLKLTKKGMDLVKRKKKLRGVMEIRNTAGTAISQTPITIRLRKRP